MQVIFLQNHGSSRVDDVKSVRSGYARYLFRYGFATVATQQDVEQAEARRQERMAKYAELQREAQDRMAQFEGVSLSFSEKANEEGHLFGSITENMVADALSEKGLSVDKAMVKMESHIKEVGEHSVSIELFEGVLATVMIEVSAS